MTTATTSTIPAARLGELIRQARTRFGVDRAELARRLGVAEAEVRAWESGRRRPRPDLLAAVVSALGTSLDAVVPPRRPVARTAGSAEEQVRAFVRLVTTMRGAAPGTPLRFRAADLEQLALALGTGVVDVEARIAALTSCTPAEATLLRRRLVGRKLLVPVAAGVFAAAMLVGGAQAAHAVEADPSTSTTSSTTDDRVAALEKQVADLKAQLEAAQKENATQAADLDAAKKHNATLEMDLEAAKKQNAVLESDLEAAKKQNATLEMDLEAAKKQNATLESDLDAAKKQNATLESDLDAAKKDNAALAAARDAAQTLAAALKADLAAVTADLNTATAENAGLRADLDTAAATAARDGATIDRLTDEAGAAARTIAAREATIRALTASLSQAVDRTDAVLADLRTARGHLADARQLLRGVPGTTAARETLAATSGELRTLDADVVRLVKGLRSAAARGAAALGG